MMEQLKQDSGPNSFEGVARILYGGAPPLWLIYHFEYWVRSLAFERSLAAKRPSRSQMKGTLDEIQSAATSLQRVLASVPVTDFLQAGELGRMEYFWEFRAHLNDLSRRAGAAGNSSALLSKRGAVRAGSGRAALADATKPLVLCAGMIAEVWKFLRDDFPPAKNMKVAEAAEMYWQLSEMWGSRDNHTDNRVGWGSNRLNRWRRHFQAAAALRITRPQALNDYIRQMTEAAAQDWGGKIGDESPSQTQASALCPSQ
jgi:hypothetical protein